MNGKFVDDCHFRLYKKIHQDLFISLGYSYCGGSSGSSYVFYSYNLHLGFALRVISLGLGLRNPRVSQLRVRFQLGLYSAIRLIFRPDFAASD